VSPPSRESDAFDTAAVTTDIMDSPSPLSAGRPFPLSTGPLQGVWRLSLFSQRHTAERRTDAYMPLCRDKTVIMWNLTREGDQYGFARRALRGHSHFVQVLGGQTLRQWYRFSCVDPACSSYWRHAAHR